MSNDTLVIIPTYNERENLGQITHETLTWLPEAHVLVADDNSPDGTGELADTLAERDPRILVLHRSQKLGLGRAYLDGFRYGLQRDYRYICEMDADFSHHPRHLPLMLEKARAGVDLVLGSRYVEGGRTENWGLARQLISRGGNVYARHILGVPIQDLTGGFKCFRREVLEQLELDTVQSNGYSFQIEMTYRTFLRGFRVEEVPIVFAERREGQSKMSRAIVAEAVWMVWRLRLQALAGGPK